MFDCEKLEFHNLLKYLKDHMLDLEPITFKTIIKPFSPPHPSQTLPMFDMPVFISSSKNKPILDFIIKNHYESYATPDS